MSLTPDEARSRAEAASLPDAHKAREEHLERELEQRNRQLAAAHRHLEVEAAVGRVRARAMAMHRSIEIHDVAAEIREELVGLEIEGVIAATIYLDQGEGQVRFWDLTRVEDHPGATTIRLDITFDVDGVPPEHFFWPVWNSKEAYAVAEADEGSLLAASSWIAQFEPSVAEEVRRLVESGELTRLWIPVVPLDTGRLTVDLVVAPPDEMAWILPKFGTAFDLAYRRFADLETAESATREAQIEAALERLRGRVNAMRHAGEMSDVVAVAFEVLGAVGFEIPMCLILAYDRRTKEADVSVAGFGATIQPTSFRFPVLDHRIYRAHLEALERRDDLFLVDFGGDEKRGYDEQLFTRTDFRDLPEPVKAGMRSIEHIWLASVPVGYGFLQVASPMPIPPERTALLRRFGRVFDTAYTRLDELLRAQADHRRILEEKTRAEAALASLRATQAQLVQQEKLASLGALTAGIAHEIKNPLNFVNNFAEVNAELAEEAREALASGDLAAAKQALADLEENATQIAKHGKRADSIVKAMMQHARGGTSERETIVVNDFLEEYAALAWHGMRARDDGFKAELVRDFAPDAGSLAVMPQELGRVVLNLLNNAFDAVRTTPGARVTIGSKRTDAGVEITISDNGPGIKPEIREKIFEPFFTTKPTGEGTGLGLSLSYDIVTKGHGGSLSVQSSPGSGAMFVLTIPTE